MYRLITVIVLVLPWNISAVADDEKLDWPQADIETLCAVSSGMALEATQGRSQGLSKKETTAKIIDLFLKKGSKSKLLKSFVDNAVYVAYKLNEFNEDTIYTIWFVTCDTQMAVRRNRSMNINFHYIDMVKDKILACENQPLTEKLNLCVIKIMAPILANH